MRPLRAYVAAPSALACRERVRAFTDAVKATPGAVLTRDWHSIVEAKGNAPDSELSAAEARGLASADIEAALAADVLFVLTWPDDPVTSGGALIEFGAVLGAAAGMVVVVGPRLPHPLFGQLADRFFLTDDTALEWWRAMCAQRGAL